LDEFPQFINVLIGEMSIIGPRPHMTSEDNMLAKELSRYRIRHWVRPGITGLAAINGFRGGTENMELMQKRINYDIDYIESWSLIGDIKICFYTGYQMITGNTKAH
jgi:putative colanic acid biosynthesis UDP-glucose lipid carrier transferase